ncbi:MULTISPECIES: hypothetical protein [unclassified Actinomyces]|uniref:hypothetical protein n=1 Tax=unclassified Actinomyces TaxID=2609248 RepID=UPI0011BED5A3|nr:MULTISPECIES: hypothetical protein [unclassified Actinomyces]
MMNEMSAEEMLGEIEAGLAGWLKKVGGERVDTYMVGIGLVQHRNSWVVIGGVRESADIDYEVTRHMNHLRAAQVLPGRGAWTWCRLWMDASDGVLHQECDWMREPTFPRASGEVRPGPRDCWSELKRFPRDDEFIPDWLRKGYEAELKRQERNARRREARRRKREQERGG